MNIIKVFEKFTKVQIILAIVICCVIGIAFLGFGTYYVVKEMKVGYEETTATVDHFGEVVDYFRDSDGNITGEIREICVDYYVNGTFYDDVVLSGYDSSFQEGQEIVIKYLPEKPEEAYLASSPILLLFFVIIGVGVLGGGIAFVFRLKTVGRRIDGLQEDGETFDEQGNAVEGTDLSTADNVATYYFSFDTKIKRGYTLKDESDNVVIEARKTSGGILDNGTYEFTNYRTGSSNSMKVGMTVTTSSGIGRGSSMLNTSVNSYFKLDGQNIWDYLNENGISVQYTFEKLPVKFNVFYHGTQIAHLVPTGRDLHAEKAKLGGLLVVNGYYRIYVADESRLDELFMACFCLARVSLFGN